MLGYFSFTGDTYMTIQEIFATYNCQTFAIYTLILGAFFTVVWYLDHKTHLRIWREDICDGELRTHRMILYASWGLQLSLALMAVAPLLALPLFIGTFITRFTHEFMDELHWHLPRCTERETILHLLMWISINTGTAVMFIWGFFYQYEGMLSLPLYLLVPMGLVALAMSYIGNREIMDYKDVER